MANAGHQFLAHLLIANDLLDSFQDFLNTGYMDHEDSFVLMVYNTGYSVVVGSQRVMVKRQILDLPVFNHAYFQQQLISQMEMAMKNRIIIDV